jgi:hypothetical protein
MYLPSCGHEKARSVVKGFVENLEVARSGWRPAGLRSDWQSDPLYEGRRGPEGVGAPTGESGQAVEESPAGID